MDIAATKRILNEYCLTPNRALGQNFLCDEGAAEAIAASAVCTDVLEIGSGLGALTEKLLQSGKRITAVEIDSAMVNVLKGRFNDNDKLNIIHADFLKADMNGLFSGEFSVAANLPYYVTTPICMKLLTCALPLRTITLMLQKEAAARFFVCPGERIYGPLTVLARTLYTVEKLFALSPSSYYPEPEVDSAVIRLTRNDLTYDARLSTLLSAAFAMRRKTLANNLKPLGITAEAISAAGIAPSVRAEALDVPAFTQLFRLLDP